MMNSSDKSVECAYFLELIEPLRKYLQFSYTELEEIANIEKLNITSTFHH